VRTIRHYALAIPCNSIDSVHERTTMNSGVILIRLIAMVVVGWAVPPLLCHYLGPAVGALGASGAAAFWYSQYRFPARRQRSSAYFWFVTSGYACIGITLVVCLSRLAGLSRL